MDSRGKRRKVSESIRVEHSENRRGAASGQSSGSNGSNNAEISGTAMVIRAAIDGVAEFPNVVFATQTHRDRFAGICTIPLVLTRFFDANSLDQLGVRSSVVDLLNGTGTSGSVTMLEYTYDSLTYEFFSSYVYEPKDVGNNVPEGRASFRLLVRSL